MSAAVPAAASAPAGDWLVACLCAGWCNTCVAYQGVMAEVARAHPGLRFAWIDIEDDADALGDEALDIETFPTLMVLHDGRPRFHGTLLPHAATLERLLQALRDGALAPGAAAEVGPAMAAAVWQLGPQRPLAG
ncbi:MAG: hypothetical protein RLY78_4295 [Pseudomonadota bacterium]|jgi:thioredoxin-like negative regulator of GroEL